MKRVQLFYDVISPFSWLGFEALCRYRSVWHMNLELNPFLLGGVQRRVGRRKFTISPAKMIYFYEDLKRSGKHFGVPLNMPKNMNEVLFVKGSLSAMRVLTAVKALHPDQLEMASRQLWFRVWSRDEDIAGPEGLLTSLKASGFEAGEAERILNASQTAEIKQTLKETTDAAVNYGIFGSPSVVVEVNGQTEILFGSDRLPLLADLIGEVYDGPLTSQLTD